MASNKRIISTEHAHVATILVALSMSFKHSSPQPYQKTQRNYVSPVHPIRKRRATPYQLKLLNSIFDHHHFVTASEIVQVARMLAMRERQVAIWFQNRRAKYKRERRVVFSKSRASAKVVFGAGLTKITVQDICVSFLCNFGA